MHQSTKPPNAREVEAASAWQDALASPGDSLDRRRPSGRTLVDIVAGIGAAIAIIVLGLLAARDRPPAKDQSRLGATAAIAAPPLPRLRPEVAP